MKGSIRLGILTATNEGKEPVTKTAVKERQLGRTSRKAAINWPVALAAAYLLLIVLCAIAPQWLAPYSPTDMRTDEVLQPPGWAHWMGTDYFGRDILSTVIYGSRSSLFIGAASVLVGGGIGLAIGALAGYGGDVADTVLMRVIDVMMTVPGILLTLTVSAALGPGLMNVIIAISLSAIPGYARVMRGQFASLSRRTYVEAARGLGASHWSVLFLHLLPNALSPLLVMGTIGIGTSILIGSSLSFLGLGAISEIPDWGTLLAQGRSYLTVAWWISTLPGMAITMLVLCVNVIGEHMRQNRDAGT